MAKIAIIETGGKQYVVTDGSVLTIEKVPAEKGGKITFDKVLLVDDGKEVRLGTPHVSGAKVTGELIKEGRDKKVTVIRYRQKSRYFKKKGHRQPYAKVKITTLP
ncbi:MAG TPA: 50S ribosomal protein L21 [Candidatus Paceibacterota bacterium]